MGGGKAGDLHYCSETPNAGAIVGKRANTVPRYRLIIPYAPPGWAGRGEGRGPQGLARLAGESAKARNWNPVRNSSRRPRPRAPRDACRTTPRWTPLSLKCARHDGLWGTAAFVQWTKPACDVDRLATCNNSPWMALCPRPFNSGAGSQHCPRFGTRDARPSRGAQVVFAHLQEHPHLAPPSPQGTKP